MASSEHPIVDRVVELRRVRAGDLVPNPRNWRRHPASQRKALRALLNDVGFADAILARQLAGGALEIVDGHLRQSMDPDMVVPVLVLDVDDHEASKLLLTLDPLSAMATADPEPLLTLLASFDTADEDLRMMLANVASDAQIRPKLGLIEPDEVAEPATPGRASVGDLFVLGDHQLVCGDARDSALLGRLLGDEHASLLLTDPPYGVSYKGKTTRALRIANDDEDGLAHLLAGAFSAINKVLEPGTPVYLFHPAGPNSAVFMQCFLDVGWQIRQELVWAKDSMVLGHSDYHFRHEPILYGTTPGGQVSRGHGRWYGGDAQTSVLEFPRPKASLSHPTTKPVALICQLLANSSTVGDIVLDPFLGSGTTLIASEQLDDGTCAPQAGCFVANGLAVLHDPGAHIPTDPDAGVLSQGYSIGVGRDRCGCRVGPCYLGVETNEVEQDRGVGPAISDDLEEVGKLVRVNRGQLDLHDVVQLRRYHQPSSANRIETASGAPTSPRSPNPRTASIVMSAPATWSLALMRWMRARTE